MATETITQIQQPPEFIEAAAKPYLTTLQQAVGDFTGADLSQVYGPQFVAGQDPLSAQAISVATAQDGLGSFRPFLQTAAAQAGQAGQFVGPQAYQQFMSPFQKDVIGATLDEFDRQSQRGIQGIADQALAAGAFGGGREGVQRAEYQAASDRNRAALQAQLLQQGFQQAQAAAAGAAAAAAALRFSAIAAFRAARASNFSFSILASSSALGSGSPCSSSSARPLSPICVIFAPEESMRPPSAEIHSDREDAVGALSLYTLPPFTFVCNSKSAVVPAVGCTLTGDCVASSSGAGDSSSSADATFADGALASADDFEIDAVEVWGCGGKDGRMAQEEWKEQQSEARRRAVRRSLLDGGDDYDEAGGGDANDGILGGVGKEDRWMLGLLGRIGGWASSGA